MCSCFVPVIGHSLMTVAPAQPSGTVTASDSVPVQVLYGRVLTMHMMRILLPFSGWYNSGFLIRHLLFPSLPRYGALLVAWFLLKLSKNGLPDYR